MKTGSLMLYKLIFLLTIPFISLPSVGQDPVHQFTDGFAIRLSGNYGREAVFQDSLLWAMSTGSRIDPAEALAAGDESGWKHLNASDKGIFRDRYLRGGYLFLEYESPRSEVVILEVSGHNEVYVNGEPRGGDVYDYGWVQHPVKLKRGKNTFLVRGSRGQVSAKLTRPGSDIIISGRDALLPDLVEGDDARHYGAVRLINASGSDLKDYMISASLDGKAGVLTEVPGIMAYSVRKIPFVVINDGLKNGEKASLTFELISPKGKVVDHGSSPEFEISCKGRLERRKETFVSDIDGSVQYYSVVPSTGDSQPGKALFFSLHGASVEAVNQAAAYSPKDWGTVVAPTNRRPYGFDWEDWGRLDAREVLEIVTEKYQPDKSRLYLTGHSMGGHGTWQFGVTYPGLWAAIAPSAGWYSFGSYAGKEEQENPSSMEDIFIKSSNPSNTIGLSKNYLHYGVYILHGDKDDNVPVTQARFMREHLASYHPDFCYYERPGAGHWWGNECVDWPPLFDFFQNHRQLGLKELKKIDFTTSSPGISSGSRFVTIWQQEKNLDLSRIELEQDTLNKEIIIRSSNVLVMYLDLGHLKQGQPYMLLCDEDSLKLDPGSQPLIFLEKNKAGWQFIDQPPPEQKGPHRSGLFKEAFQNNMIFVYGTSGSRDENEWARNKARFDAETFWYRGNGSIDVITDKEFIEKGAPGRNVILYGHSEMNSAWQALLAGSPLMVTRGSVALGDRVYEGDDLSVCFIYPRADENNTSVGIIAGSGMPGMLAATPNRYFVSGSAYPDFMVYRAKMLIDGISGVTAAGFFNRHWQLSDKESEIK